MGEFARNILLQFSEFQCGGCGVWFAFENNHLEKKSSENATFYCPNGCRHKFTDESYQDKAIRLARELQQQKIKTQWAENDAKKSKEREKKIKKRIANGVCPCCNRQFVNLERHMATKHKDFKK